ncbi:hypothetical protein Tco_1083659 [Tanacetum coccineum]
MSNDVAQLVDTKRGSYTSIAPKLEDHVIAKISPETKKAFTSLPISTAFFPNVVVQLSRAQDNLDDEDEKEVSSNDDEMVNLKVLMAQTDDENLTLDAEWKTYLDYIDVDVKFVEEQRLNLFSNEKLTVGKEHARNGQWVDVVAQVCIRANCVSLCDYDEPL